MVRQKPIVDRVGNAPKAGGTSGGRSSQVDLAQDIISLGIALEDKVAVTGEITLQGRVLSVGGVKEKVIAARRAGMTTVVLPKENDKDLVELPKEVRDAMSFVLVATLEEALGALLTGPKRKRG